MAISREFLRGVAIRFAARGKSGVFAGIQAGFIETPLGGADADFFTAESQRRPGNADGSGEEHARSVGSAFLACRPWLIDRQIAGEIPDGGKALNRGTQRGVAATERKDGERSEPQMDTDGHR